MADTPGVDMVADVVVMAADIPDVVVVVMAVETPDVVVMVADVVATAATGAVGGVTTEAVAGAAALLVRSRMLNLKPSPKTKVKPDQ